MPVQPPSRADVLRLAAVHGLPVSEDNVDAYQELVGAGLAGYQGLDELVEETVPVRWPRADLGRRPAVEDNPFGGWAWRCSVPGAPSGPLQGMRVGVKDNIAVAGVPLLNGSQMMEGYVPREDATVVTRLLDAGAEVVGKTAVPGYCFDGGGITGYPDPQPVNPWDPTRMAGSSSNGSAVVVVTGQVDLALGGDQGGSVRMPASWSGCVGHKPTHGLVPYTGAFPIETTLDHLGPMARDVATCARALAVLAGADGLDPRQVGVQLQDYVAALELGAAGLRVGVLAEGFDWPGVSDPAVDATVRAAAEALREAGATVQEVSVPMHRHGLAIWNAIATQGATDQMVRGDAVGTGWRGAYPTALVDAYGAARRARAADYPPTVAVTVLTGDWLAERHGHHYYAKAQNLGRALARRYEEALQDVDVLLLPTTAMTAQAVPPVDASVGETVAAALGNLHNTAPFDVTGNPAISVPCGLADGLPVGAMFVGRHFDDATVLRAGAAYELARGAWQGPPSR
ncbi:amidase [Rhodococcus sp. X156]|uniref:amidase n=1 Tax=Rhodococcus sp. X156 TaxID=2499145 RepID=UPI000FDC8A08|nr:amidase [Rhodococcus sp. X156]